MSVRETVGSWSLPSTPPVNRTTINRRLIDGRPADLLTGPAKINRQTDQKRPGLLDVDLIDLVLTYEIPEKYD